MLLQRSTVSRKTPKDGRLEITEQSAKKLLERGGTLRVIVGAADDVGVVSRMACTCRGEDTRHEHHFLESDVLKSLLPESAVELELVDDQPRVVVSPASVTT